MLGKHEVFSLVLYFGCMGMLSSSVSAQDSPLLLISPSFGRAGATVTVFVNDNAPLGSPAIDLDTATNVAFGSAFSLDFSTSNGQLTITMPVDGSVLFSNTPTELNVTTSTGVHTTEPFLFVDLACDSGEVPSEDGTVCQPVFTVSSSVVEPGATVLVTAAASRSPNLLNVLAVTLDGVAVRLDPLTSNQLRVVLPNQQDFLPDGTSAPLLVCFAKFLVF